MSIAYAYGEVFFGKAECAHGGDGEGEEFCVCGDAGFAEDVCVELEEFTATAFLWFFVAEALADFKPFEWFGEISLVGGTGGLAGGLGITWGLDPGGARSILGVMQGSPNRMLVVGLALSVLFM